MKSITFQPKLRRKSYHPEKNLISEPLQENLLMSDLLKLSSLEYRTFSFQPHIAIIGAQLYI